MQKERSPAQLDALASAREKRAIAKQRTAPEGWRSVDHLMLDTREYCAKYSIPGHSSELRALATYLRVGESSVRRWLNGEKTPLQPTIAAIAQWRRNRKAGF